MQTFFEVFGIDPQGFIQAILPYIILVVVLGMAAAYVMFSSVKVDVRKHERNQRIHKTR